MSKTCAFLGNDYDKVCGRKCGHNTPHNLKEHVKEEIIKLIEQEDVNTFFVGELGGYETDCYDVVLEVKKQYPEIHIVLVISKIQELNKFEKSYVDPEERNKTPYMIQERDFDEFVYPIDCEFGYRKLSIVYRNRYIIENTDFIIAYNQRQGRAYEFCKQARNKGVNVIELTNLYDF